MYLSIYFLVTLVQLHASDTCKYTDSSRLSRRKRLDLYQRRPQGLFVFRYGSGGECNLCSVYIILVKLSDGRVLHTAFGVLQNQASKYPCRYHDGEYVAILENEKSLGTGLELY